VSSPEYRDPVSATEFHRTFSNRLQQIEATQNSSLIRRQLEELNRIHEKVKVEKHIESIKYQSFLLMQQIPEVAARMKRERDAELSAERRAEQEERERETLTRLQEAKTSLSKQ
jgi:hypothetical protein